MKKRFKVLSILLIVLISISACSSKDDNSQEVGDNLEVDDLQNTSSNLNDSAGKNTSDYGIISDDVGAGFILEVDIDKPVKNISKIFNGGGQEVEIENIVRFLYAEKEVRTLTTDKGSSIYYLSTKNINDKTIRGIGVGDSLDELLKAYPEGQLVLQETWDSVVLAEYDTAYKLVVDDERRQAIFLLKENVITMIQIADMQNNDNSSFDWDFVK